ncbi:Nicalin related protein [Babesia ovis]|uniref:BOS complex subunit NCLN n=1 Tax=Babesia ovis TaxID=5869 RepID=A0A9W5TAQ8_BABOV|nr:Nicalin related protein [Babesia ovis]
MIESNGYELKGHGATELEVHTLSGFKLADQDYGFPSTIHYGRTASIRASYPDLVAQSSQMSDAELEDALAQRMQKKTFALILRLNDILKDRFDFFTFRMLLKQNGGMVTIIIPPPSKILPGSPPGCTECPMLETSQDSKKKVCNNDISTFHQATMDAFHTFLQGCDSKALVALVEESESALSVMQNYGSTIPPSGTVNRYRSLSPSHRKIINYRSLNVYGVLRSAQKEETSDKTSKSNKAKAPKEIKEPNPTTQSKIVICSHIDTFSLLQSYRTAATNNSGLIALLELARLLENMDHNGYEIIFLLTTGSVLNFQGATTFANTYAQIDNVELVICLDDMTDSQLYLHTASKATEVSSLFQRNIARSVKATLTNAVKADAPLLFFQHEQFTRQKVHAITLTSVKDRIAFPLRQKPFEYNCDPTVLARHIVNIFQALTKTLRLGKVKIDKSLVEANIKDWEAKLGSPRCGFTGDIYQEEGVRSIIRYFNQLMSSFNTQKVARVLPGFEFQSNIPLRILFYRNHTMLYHICVMMASFVYIFTMWSIIRGSPWMALHDITSSLNASSPQSVWDPSVSKRRSRRS